MYKFVIALFTSQALAIKVDGVDFGKLEHCPDFDERFTLVDGRTQAVPYPRKGYNCHKEGSFTKTLVQVFSEVDPTYVNLQNCPDFDERFTLVDGRTKAVAWPAKGYNCQKEGTFVRTALSQELSQLPDFGKLEHCPDFDERFTLVDGRTKAVAWPAKGYNCHKEGSYTKTLAQSLCQKDPDFSKLEHCPDFDERYTLVDGRTKAVAWPAKGYNCQKEGVYVKSLVQDS